MIFNDDDEISPATVDASEEDFPEFKAGDAAVKIIMREEAPLGETQLKALVKVTGSGENNVRCPLDLVTVLDVSSSMKKDNRLQKLKTAMQFLIKKLSPVDRLSVVTFSKKARMIFPLLQITENSLKKIEKEVLDLQIEGGTNIADGLELGLQVLNRFKDGGRVGAIMLMSDGEQTYRDATKVQIDNVAVYTFGFGKDFQSEVLQKISNNSKGGTFSYVREENNLNIAFAKNLAGLMTVVVQELYMTISTKTKDTPPEREAKIENVSAGNYRPTNKENSSATISFGELYDKEERRIMVNLRLFGVNSKRSSDVLVVTSTYRTATGKPLLDANPITATVTRTGTPNTKEKDEVVIEENRLETVNVVKEARKDADKKNLDRAKNKLGEARNSLAAVKVDDPYKIIEMLIYDLQQLIKLMRTQRIYETEGRFYALSFESSHDNQRYASRGDDLEKQKAFSTPPMDTFFKQAKKFDEASTKAPHSVQQDVKEEGIADPTGPTTNPPPSVDQTDVKEEVDAKPVGPIPNPPDDRLGPIIEALSDCIKTSIQALKSTDLPTFVFTCMYIGLFSYIYASIYM